MRFARVLPVAVHAAERYGSEVTYRADAGQKWSVARGRRLAQARVALLTLLRLSDRGGWVAPGVLGCAYPRTERALAVLSGRGLREVHLPVKDFAAPSPAQVERGVEAILGALAAGEAAAVHCGGGLGRTGTLLACYLASGEGYGGGEAIRRVRALRPGSVETAAQAAAVEAWARRMGPTRA
jgi:hypothetical protein